VADEEGGKLHLEVEADTTGFGERLRAAVERAASGVNARVGVEVDSEALSERLRTALGEASANLRAQVGFNVQPAELRDRLRAAVASASRGTRAEVGVAVNSSGLRDRLRTAVASASRNLTANVTLGVDQRALRDRLRVAVQRSSAGVRFNIPIRIDTAGLRARLRAIVDAAVAGVVIRLGTDIDAAALRRQVRAARDAAQEEARVRPIRVPVRADTTGKGGLSKLTSDLGKLKIPAIASFILPAVQAVSALAAGLVALTSAIAPASGLLLGLPAAAVAGVTAFAALKIGTSGLSDGFKAVSRAQQEQAATGKLTKAQYQQLQAALKNLTPEQRAFLNAVLDLGPAWTQMRHAVQAQLFTGLAPVVSGLGNIYIPVLRAALVGVAGAFNNAALQAGGFLAQAETTSRIAEITQHNTAAFTTLSRATAPLLDIFIRLTQVASPYLERMASLVVRFAEYTDRAVSAGQETGRLGRFMERAWQTASTLGRIALQAGTGIFNIFRAASFAGASILPALDRLTERFARWTESTRGQITLESYFQRAMVPLRSVLGLLGDLATAFGRMAGSTDRVTPIINAFRTDLAPAVTQLVNNLSGGLAPAIIQAASALARLLTTVSGGGGGGALTAFVTTIRIFLDVVNGIITTVPGGSRAVGGLLIAFGTYRAASGIVGFLKSTVGGIRDMVTAARSAGTAVVGFVRGFRDISRGAAEGASAATRLGAALRANLAIAAASARQAIASAATAALNGARSFLSMAAAVTRSAAALAANAARAVASRIATIAMTIAQRAARIATIIWTAVTWALSAAWEANPIGVIAIAIIALVAGVIYAYKHFAFFRNIVDAVGRALRVGLLAAFHALQPVIDFAITHWRLLISILLGPLGVAIVLIIRYWDTIKNAVVTAVTTVVSFVQNHWRLLISILLGPLGIVIVLLIDYWNTIKNAVVTAVTTVVSFVEAHWRLLVAILLGPFALIIAGLLLLWSQITGIVSAGASAVVSVVQGAWNLLQAVTSAVWSAISSYVSGSINAVVGIVHGIEQVAGIVGGAFQSAYNATVGKVGDLVSYAGGIPGRVVQALAGLGDQMYNAGREAIQRLIDGISHMLGSLISKMGDVAKAVTSHLPLSPAKVGPLSGKGDPLISGRKIIERLVSGVATGEDQLLGAAGKLAGTLAQVFEPAISLGEVPTLNSSSVLRFGARAAATATPVTNNHITSKAVTNNASPTVNVTLNGAQQTSQEQAFAVGREAAWMLRGVMA
jgi:phage-related protein